MDIRQLEAFLAVVDHGSFSAAAAAMFTVQSNVSTHVARLERELGTTLLDRRERTLTAAGRAVEAKAREIVASLESIPDDLAALEDRTIGHVACGTTPSVGLWILPPALASATELLPDVTISFVEGQSDDLVQRVLGGSLDLAITTGVADPEVERTPLFDEDIVAVVAGNHRLAQANQLVMRDLVDETVLLPRADNPLHRHIAQELERAGLRLPATLEVGSSALVTAMAGAGLGVAVVPATAALSTAAAAPVAATKQFAIADLAPRQVAITTRSGTRASRALAAFSELLESTARARAVEMPGCEAA